MRHAPERFVQQGNAAWFDHHGFEQTRRSRSPRLSLEVRVNRPRTIYEFMEPVVIELKLKNMSSDLQVIDDHYLATSDRVTVIIRQEGRPARRFNPFAQYCWQSAHTVLPPGESVYESLFVSAGKGGWDLAEPGRYLIQAALHLDDEDIVSAPLTIRIAPPQGYEEEFLAQDLFTDEVGRSLAFDGTRTLESANNTLREVRSRLPGRRVAIHAAIALACPMTQNYKSLQVDPKKPREEQLAFKADQPRMDQALEEFRSAIDQPRDVAAESLGHIDYADYTIRFSRQLADAGEADLARDLAHSMLTTLSKRAVPDNILAQLQARLPDIGEGKEKRNEGRRPSRPIKERK